MFIDTHAHLTMPEYTDLSQVLERAKQTGVEAIINVSFDLDCSRKSVELAARNDNIYAAVGIHPNHAAQVTADMFEELKILASNKKVVAIGETGLDYYCGIDDKQAQKDLFAKHVDIAKDLNLPVIIHDREAHDDILINGVRGVFHCFSGDIDMAKEVLSRGFYISFVGNITFKNADKLREVVSFAPLERIMIETDCPYLSPVPFRGRRNEPSNIVHIARAVAQIKCVSIDEIARITTKNARELFAIV